MATLLSPRQCDSNPATPGAQSLKDDTEENLSDGSQAPKRRRMDSGDSSRSCDTSSQELGLTYFPAENLTEYKWPPDDTGEYYMLQEQASQLCVDEVIDLMIRSIQLKCRVLGYTQEASGEDTKEYSSSKTLKIPVEASKVPETLRKLLKRAEFNSNYPSTERMEERRAYLDDSNTNRTKTGPYPVALIPGQSRILKIIALPLQPKVIPNAICGICQKGKESNKKGKPEALIHCSQCQNSGHPSCLDMSAELVALIKTYPWQCMECKTCTVCEQPHHEEEMMFCDKCDRGFHTFCVGMELIPLGCWVCDCCHKNILTPKKKLTGKLPKKS
ncbi:PHD finger protein 10 [Bagarius yarrelli]|uniref:PHD finger protein 10 n=1 Tax=Bagarius yarrelli TaxID=175774 RepID=A0A556TR64_BAGYA|nr:PHD finger protein 10 [Bagarius yarrelli]